MTNKATIYLIDDDDAVRDSLSFLLETEGFIAESYESAVSFLDLEQIKPGCVITDMRMPEISGLDLIEKLKQMRVSCPVIVITGHGDIPLAVEAMRAGAFDFIEKPFDDETILGAVQNALRQHKPALPDEDQMAIRARVQALSERERQVLIGLVAGKSNKVIAGDLGISPRTVEIYRANVMSKMRAPSLSALVRMAILVDLS